MGISQKRMKKRIEEGLVYAVCVDGGGYARLVLARWGTRRICLGYFFGPLSERAEMGFEGLTPDRAILVCRFGDMAIREGEWAELGALPEWERVAWSVPWMAREPDPGEVFLSRYDDETLEHCEEVAGVPEDMDRLPADRLSGSRAVEIHLRGLLATAG